MGDGPRGIERERRYTEAAATFGAALERLAMAYERDPDKRRDLVQDIHVALWRSLARFDGTSKILRPQTNAPTIVALDDSPESAAVADSEEVALDRRRALERVHDLIRALRPLDRQVMLLYLEQLDAASIAEITGLSPANVATKVRRIKQALIQGFHDRKRHGQAI